MAGNDGTDDLIAAVKRGDDDAFTRLCARYSALIDSSAEKYARLGREYGELNDDFRQEASVALYRAAMSYDLTQKSVTFGLYAKTCIRNSLISQLRKLGSRPLRSRRSHESVEENVENAVVSEETLRLFVHRVEGVLSPLEAQVLLMSLEGAPPRYISKALGADVKAVYNALFRAREKLREDPGILS